MKKSVKGTIVHTCGECGHGVPDTRFLNLSIDGKPTIVHCPFKQYAQVVSETACDKFKPR